MLCCFYRHLSYYSSSKDHWTVTYSPKDQYIIRIVRGEYLVSVLYTKSEILRQLFSFEKWEINAFQQFTEMVTDDEQKYPCIPCQVGFMSGHLRYGFVGDPRMPNTAKDIAKLLEAYGECSRETGKYSSLVIFCKTPVDLLNEYKIQDYEKLFWSLLTQVSDLDKLDWPSQISTDPNDSTWEFSFDGHPYFCFNSTPAHSLRKSRYFPYYLLAFQPRWVFEGINDHTKIGRTMKKAIRERLEKFDSVPAHPSLQWYGSSENLEWKQYFLPDDNQIPTKCPFSNMKHKQK